MKSDICPSLPPQQFLAFKKRLKRAKMKLTFSAFSLYILQILNQLIFISFKHIFHTRSNFITPVLLSWLMRALIQYKRSEMSSVTLFCSLCIDLKWAGISPSWLSYLRINWNLFGEKSLLTLIKNLERWIALLEIQYRRSMKEFASGLSFKYFITELLGVLQNKAGWLV